MNSRKGLPYKYFASKYNYIIRPLAKIKNLPLGKDPVVSESGELRISINQLNAYYKHIMRFYAYFSHF